MASPHAFVTLISSDAYLPGALTQVAALNDLHDKRDYQTVCLVTPESVDVATIKALRKAFDVVVGVEILEDSNERGLKLLGRPDLTTVLTKLHVFRLTQFSKIIFLDADVLPLRPLSHLFDLPHEFSAVPDVGWPDIFNSGVLVLSPGEDKFNELCQLLKSKGSWDGGDQGLLNEWRGGDWHRLSFTYNTTPTAAYTYAPAYERYGSSISALHFIGKNKPWNSIAYRTPFTTRASTSKDSEQAYDYESLVDRWYAVYDKHYRSQPASQPPRFEFKRYTSAWDEPTPSPVSQPKATETGVFGLDKLRQMAVDGVAAAVGSDRRPHGEGIYYSLPLEGRVDLMRPRKPEPETAEVDGASTEGPTTLPGDPQRPPNLDFELEDVLPSTPQFRTSALYGEDEAGIYRWQSHPPTHPDDASPSPHFDAVALPPSLTQRGFEPVKSDFYASESEQEEVQARKQAAHDHSHSTPSRPGSRPTSRRPSQSHGRPLSITQPSSQGAPPGQNRRTHPNQLNDHPHRHEHKDHVHHHLHSHSQAAPRRPLSPPLLAWNPALEPPPKDPPVPSAFPSDTYFPNLWDQPQQLKLQDPSGPSPPTSINFFQPLPPPEIPETLIKQGHYRNVTGEDSLTPSPDRTKVKSVFPWEERPRVLPNRVFPDTDTPPPALFLNPSSPSQTSTAAPSTPEQSKSTPLGRVQPLSPLIGFPPTLTYSNAWDTVPSIQKYASKLVRPLLPPPPLAPAFDDERWRKPRRKSWDERVEASSRDGDDEDNADDEDEDDDFAVDTKWDDSDDDSKRSRHVSRRRSLVQPMSKSSKDYRDQAVQTVVSSLRSQGIQTEKTVKKASSTKRHSIAASSPSFLVPPSTRDAAASTAIDNPTSITAPIAQRPPLSGRPSKIKSGNPSPVVSPRVRSPMRSPVREFIVPAAPQSSAGHPSRPPMPRVSTQTPPIGGSNEQNGHWSPSVSRQMSNDSSITSPASSSASGFPDYQIVGDKPVRVGGRVFDPARGVEIFKRGSEEVLARFLKMGNWESEAAR
ncbi:glycogenin glucosyltransferase [Coprinopsis cinerea okayama7|uniref:glycogenin glucosyltransferase n=1 Tax=Coprinopsis cinerea (strain Okayama-7 / 130 / ATCC MYA-4618 / FGSC 9003) TaxID=240176 RepID=A8N2S3_COPC7|nr:glycogenin glucosyltransferase [Coprinopsis cinerea okayama7\|eukprot:XP_001829145.1 glycogenin glucosyltransferase [Coprinopsis cinerea okayama7\